MPCGGYRGSFTMHSHETGDPFNHIMALLKKTAVNAELCSDKHRYDEAQLMCD